MTSRTTWKHAFKIPSQRQQREGDESVERGQTRLICRHLETTPLPSGGQRKNSQVNRLGGRSRVIRVTLSAAVGRRHISKPQKANVPAWHFTGEIAGALMLSCSACRTGWRTQRHLSPIQPLQSEFIARVLGKPGLMTETPGNPVHAGTGGIDLLGRVGQEYGELTAGPLHVASLTVALVGGRTLNQHFPCNAGEIDYDPRPT
jgi:hypothetical protein